MSAVLMIVWTLFRSVLAPIVALGLVVMIIFGGMAREEAWIWMGENEWFTLSMTAYLFVGLCWLELVA